MSFSAATTSSRILSDRCVEGRRVLIGIAAPHPDVQVQEQFSAIEHSGDVVPIDHDECGSLRPRRAFYPCLRSAL